MSITLDKECSVDFHTNITFGMDEVKEFFSAYSFNDDTKEHQIKEILDSMDDYHEVQIYTEVEEDYVSVQVDIDEDDIEEALDSMTEVDKLTFLKKQLAYSFDFPVISNLADEAKFEILCQMFEKYSLEELQQKI
jgi:hypothetical protein